MQNVVIIMKPDLNFQLRDWMKQKKRRVSAGINYMDLIIGEELTRHKVNDVGHSHKTSKPQVCDKKTDIYRYARQREKKMCRL